MNNSHEIIWVGTRTGIENKLVPQNINLLTIPMRGFRGKNFLSKIISLIGLVTSFFKCIFYIQKNNIDYVVCFGDMFHCRLVYQHGFAKALFLHEQNAIMGSSNKILKKFSKIIFLGFSINESVITK